MSPDGRTSNGPTPIVFDTTVLSNFARSRSIRWLVCTTAVPVTVPAVERELRRGRDEGYRYLQSALDWLRHAESVPETPTNEMCVLDSTPPNHGPEGATKLDPGEADALRGAWPDRVLATDDLDARRLAGKSDVEVTGSVGILVDGVSRGELSTETADEWLRTWERAGYRSPVDSVTDLID